MSESRLTILASPSGDIGMKELMSIIPESRRRIGVRKFCDEILYARYCVEPPFTLRALARFYGVKFQRIHQIIVTTLDWLARNNKHLELPEGSRLRAAIERRIPTT